MSVYQFSAEALNGEHISLEKYKGNTLLIVNTASKCGFTPQLKELQELFETYKSRGLIILGFPCNQFMNQDPGTNENIEEFCQINYGVTFPMFKKVNVNGADAHPLFQYISEQKKGLLGTKAIKWNFTKFLINRDGKVVKRFSPNTTPLSLKEEIERLL